MNISRMAGALLLAGFSTLVSAGLVNTVPVSVTLEADGSGSASGNMVTARFADNEYEYIGCGTGAIDEGYGLYEYGWCQAADSQDNRVYCQTTRADLLNVMKATSSYAYITFSWNADGECNFFGFSTQSFYIPEHVSEEPGRGRGRP